MENQLNSTQNDINNEKINNFDNQDNAEILKIINSIHKRAFKVMWLCISILIIGISTIFVNFIPVVGFWIFLILWLICIGIAVIALVLNIMNAVKILTTDFKNEEINNSKTIWGIFTIIILGWISSLIFSISAKNKLTNK